MGFFSESRTWVAVAFVLFFLIFGKRLWGALAELLDSRAAAVRRELEEATRLRQEAEQMRQEAQQRRDTAVREAQALIEGARAEAERLAAAAADEARAAARRASRWRSTGLLLPRRLRSMRCARPPPRWPRPPRAT